MRRGRLTRANDQGYSEQIFEQHRARRVPMLGAFPDDLEGYVKLEAVREENCDGDHDLHGLCQTANNTNGI